MVPTVSDTVSDARGIGSEFRSLDVEAWGLSGAALRFRGRTPRPEVRDPDLCVSDVLEALGFD